MKSARILYITIHPLVSDAIRLCLINNSNGHLNISIMHIDDLVRSTIKFLVANPPDLILYPIGFPGSYDLHLVSKHRALGVKAPIIVLCLSQYLPSFDDLVKNDVQGVISTSFGLEELREAIYAVLDSKPETLKDQYARATAVSHQVAQNCGLTLREVNILHMLSAGTSDTDISQKLEISPKTVRGYLRCINIKLKAKNRIHAIVTAISKGIISPYIEDF